MHYYVSLHINEDGTSDGSYEWSKTVLKEAALERAKRVSVSYDTNAQKAEVTAAYTLNLNNPLGRHSGEGRNPAIKNTPRSGQNNGVVPLTWEFVNQLDTGLRRYDAVSSNGFFGLKADGRHIDVPKDNYQVAG